MLMKAEKISKSFIGKGGLLRKKRRLEAVRAVDLEIHPGETVGLVGESGCGKSTLGRCLIRLTTLDSGRIYFDGVDITTLGSAKLMPLRRQMQIIFQDPYSSLNPRSSIASIVEEPLLVHALAPNRTAIRELAADLVKQVGLSADVLDRYPHEFSAGQRQRIGIARAIAVRPKLIVCDEPVSALDVSVQAQIVNLLLDLQAGLRLSYLFISHDLSIVRHMAHRVAVMYLGTIVEQGPARDLYERPLHPYTQALLSAIPSVFRSQSRTVLTGEPPQPAQIPRGCTFHPRCPVAKSICQTDVPALRRVGEARKVACLLV